MRLNFQPILFLSFLALTLPGCQYLSELFGPVLQHPQVSVREIQVLTANANELKIKVKFLIQNPNSFSLEFSNLNYEISVSQRLIASGDHESKIELPREANTVVEVPLRISSMEALQVLHNVARKKKQLRLQIRGAVDFHSRLGTMKIPFNHERDFF